MPQKIYKDASNAPITEIIAETKLSAGTDNRTTTLTFPGLSDATKASTKDFLTKYEGFLGAKISETNQGNLQIAVRFGSPVMTTVGLLQVKKLITPELSSSVYRYCPDEEGKEWDVASAVEKAPIINFLQTKQQAAAQAARVDVSPVSSSTPTTPTPSGKQS